MGCFIAKALDIIRGKQEVRILMVGLDASGKTTILKKLKLADRTDIVTTTPTIGCNVETVEYKNITFTVWDLSGQEKIRRSWLWEHYYQCSQGVIFVVDSNDRERICDKCDSDRQQKAAKNDDNFKIFYNTAKDELHRMLAGDELLDAVLLVLANKQDLPNAMSVDECTEKLGLNQLRRPWYIQSSCATAGDGLYEGLDWLAKQFKKHKKESQ